MEDERADHLLKLFAGAGDALIPEAKQMYARLALAAESGYEWIESGDGSVIGFLMKGEGERWLEALHNLPDGYDIPISFSQSLSQLSQFSARQKGFCKLEWAVNQSVQRKLSVYFRVGGDPESLLQFLEIQGISAEVLSDLQLVADIFQKEIPHFLAISAVWGEFPIWKIYFTQWVDSESFATVLRRLLTVMEWLGISPEAMGQLVRIFPVCHPEGSGKTLFVSLSFNAKGILPTVKVDFEQVDPAIIAPDHLPEGRHARVEAITQNAKVSYWGWKCTTSPAVSHKFYWDGLGF